MSSARSTTSAHRHEPSFRYPMVEAWFASYGQIVSRGRCGCGVEVMRFEFASSAPRRNRCAYFPVAAGVVLGPVHGPAPAPVDGPDEPEGGDQEPAPRHRTSTRPDVIGSANAALNDDEPDLSAQLYRAATALRSAGHRDVAEVVDGIGAMFCEAHPSTCEIVLAELRLPACPCRDSSSRTTSPNPPVLVGPTELLARLDLVVTALRAHGMERTAAEVRGMTEALTEAAPQARDIVVTSLFGADESSPLARRDGR